MKSEFEWIAIDLQLCMHCGACVGTCPNNALFLHDLTVGANEKCKGCGTCTLVCPVGAIEKEDGSEGR